MQRPKHRTKFNPSSLMDFRKKIKDVMDAAACARHDVPIGVPCFHVPRETGGYYPAICAKRIGKVYNGQIDPKSVRKSSKKEHSR